MGKDYQLKVQGKAKHDSNSILNHKSYFELQSNSYGSESNYYHALPSPVPSAGSLSPCHSDRGFLSPPQTVAFVDMSLSPRPCSTVDTLDILSPPASVRSEL